MKIALLGLLAILILSGCTQNQAINNLSCGVIQIEYNFLSSEEDSRNAIAYLNQIRKSQGKNEIVFDERLFRLAVARAKDMRENNYLDHTNPISGACPDNMKLDFGLKANEFVAENVSGNEEYFEGQCTEIEFHSMTEEIDRWMTSRGHRYNLLYDNHTAGAVGCYKNMCAFLGLTHDEYDLGGGGCYTAAEGEAFWNTNPLQPGEAGYIPSLEPIEPFYFPEIEPIRLPPSLGGELVEPSEPVYTKDKCEWTWPEHVLESQYNECYNDNYILKIKADTEAEFCMEIEDPYFLSRCLKELAWKKKDLSICENGKDAFIEFARPLDTYLASASDNCYHEYELNYGPRLKEEERFAICEKIESKELRYVCDKNVKIGLRS